MKKLIFTFLTLCFSLGLIAQSTPPSAQSVLDDACKIALAEKKNVCIIFHASWCGWCHRMDSIMNMPANKDFFENNWVTRHLVVMEHTPELKKLENPGGAELMEKYNGKNSGIPYWLIFNPKGQLLFDSRMPTKDRNGMHILTNTGCPAAPEEVEFFSYILKHSTNLTDAEIASIGQTFLLKK